MQNLQNLLQNRKKIPAILWNLATLNNTFGLPQHFFKMLRNDGKCGLPRLDFVKSRNDDIGAILRNFAESRNDENRTTFCDSIDSRNDDFTLPSLRGSPQGLTKQSIKTVNILEKCKIRRIHAIFLQNRKKIPAILWNLATLNNTFGLPRI